MSTEKAATVAEKKVVVFIVKVLRDCYRVIVAWD
jgi:hypothetical protein